MPGKSSKESSRLFRRPSFRFSKRDHRQNRQQLRAGHFPAYDYLKKIKLTKMNYNLFLFSLKYLRAFCFNETVLELTYCFRYLYESLWSVVDSFLKLIQFGIIRAWKFYSKCCLRCRWQSHYTRSVGGLKAYSSSLIETPPLPWHLKLNWISHF